MADNNQDINQLLKVRREKLAELQEQGNDPFTITKYDVTAHTQQIKDNYEQFEGKDVSIAGRMMSKRVMGKALSAIFRTETAIFSAMWQETALERMHIRHLRKWISVIS